MKSMIMAFAITAVFICASGYAVPPAYEGQFGNPEEPALRVVKWPWLGLRKFVVSTHEGLKSGMDKESLCATAEDGANGAAQGARILVDHTARGMVYAPLPEKESLYKTSSYEDHAMAYIQAVTEPEMLTEMEEAADSPDESACEDEGVKREAEEKYVGNKIQETDVQKAQRHYVPLRAATRDRVWSGGGNLLKLAR